MVRTVPSQQKNSILLIRHQALSEDHPEQGESPPQSIMPPAQMCSSLSSPSYRQELELPLELPPLHSRIFHLPDTPTSYYSPTSGTPDDNNPDSRGHLVQSEEMQRNRQHLLDHRSTLGFRRNNHAMQYGCDSHPSDRVLRCHCPPERVSSHCIPQSKSPPYPWYHDKVNVLSPFTSSQEYSDGRPQVHLHY
jgi:hypothetical protein